MSGQLDARAPHLPGLQRAGLLISIGLLASLAWTYLFYLDWNMSQMNAADMPDPATGLWGVRELLLLFAMWVVMMAAMMLPSVVPMLLAFAAMSRKMAANPVVQNHIAIQPWYRSWIFLSGYLTVWTGFSLLAVLAQSRPWASLMKASLRSAFHLTGLRSLPAAQVTTASSA